MTEEQISEFLAWLDNRDLYIVKTKYDYGNLTWDFDPVEEEDLKKLLKEYDGECWP